MRKQRLAISVVPGRSVKARPFNFVIVTSITLDRCTRQGTDTKAAQLKSEARHASIELGPRRFMFLLPLRGLPLKGLPLQGELLNEPSSRECIVSR